MPGSAREDMNGKAIEKNPAALNLHYRLGRALLLQSHEPENLELARKEFEAELALNPGDAVAHFPAQVQPARHGAVGARTDLEDLHHAQAEKQMRCVGRRQNLSLLRVAIIWRKSCSLFPF